MYKKLLFEKNWGIFDKFFLIRTENDLGILFLRSAFKSSRLFIKIFLKLLLLLPPQRILINTSGKYAVNILCFCKVVKSVCIQKNFFCSF